MFCMPRLIHDAISTLEAKIQSQEALGTKRHNSYWLLVICIFKLDVK